jgi:hypothetical protein
MSILGKWAGFQSDQLVDLRRRRPDEEIDLFQDDGSVAIDTVSILSIEWSKTYLTLSHSIPVL